MCSTRRTPGFERLCTFVEGHRPPGTDDRSSRAIICLLVSCAFACGSLCLEHCSRAKSEQRPRFSTCSTGLLETLETLTLKLDGVLHSHEVDGTGCLNHGKDCSRLLKEA